ncbi:Tyrosinase ustQ [Cladobotryum mycophilum]|uniref:Tyrosinase ustQ n=1 Tax=Cladobotryum mycophilum TaxID=491253 RepID=A0ABR0S881_9HYPO
MHVFKKADKLGIYLPISKSENADIDAAEAAQSTSSSQRHKRIRLLGILFLIVGSVLAVNLFLFLKRGDSGCRNPSKRREWRTLQPEEQETYINAVLCLMYKDSKHDRGSSRYDDLAYAHVLESSGTHDAAAFLPWHRYFLHIYETTLREECGYHGGLVYWDWTLDADNLEASPIWDNVLGFGSNGEATGVELYKGHCVRDGPFGNTTRVWQSKPNGHGYDAWNHPHCLSRGFQSGATKEKLQNLVKPEKVNTILKHNTYRDFFMQLEKNSHDAIPQFIRGDFIIFTAPNDPVFYLHHTQLDRLWWTWQERNPASRMSDFQGPKENTKFSEAAINSTSSLEDWMKFGDFGKPLKVKQVMSTKSKDLCYEY